MAIRNLSSSFLCYTELKLWYFAVFTTEASMGNLDPRLEQILTFPQVQGIFGRRSRRFGFGMEIPDGHLAYLRAGSPSRPGILRYIL